MKESVSAQFKNHISDEEQIEILCEEREGMTDLDKLFRAARNLNDEVAAIAIGIFCPNPKHKKPRDELIDLSVKDIYGFSLLHYAAKRGLEKTTKKLLEYGAPVNLKDEMGCTPLVLATGLLAENLTKIPPIIQMLVDYKSNVLECNTGQDSCSHLAVSSNNLEVFKLFASKIKNPSSFNVMNNRNLTPLHLAVILGYVDIVNYLVNKLNIDVNFSSPDYGMTSLHYAALYNRPEIISILTQMDELGCPIGKVLMHTSNNYTPLRCAREMNHYEVEVEILQAEKRETTYINKLLGL